MCRRQSGSGRRAHTTIVPELQRMNVNSLPSAGYGRCVVVARAPACRRERDLAGSVGLAAQETRTPSVGTPPGRRRSCRSRRGCSHWPGDRSRSRASSPGSRRRAWSRCRLRWTGCSSGRLHRGRSRWAADFRWDSGCRCACPIVGSQMAAKATFPFVAPLNVAPAGAGAQMPAAMSRSPTSRQGARALHPTAPGPTSCDTRRPHRLTSCPYGLVPRRRVGTAA